MSKPSPSEHANAQIARALLDEIQRRAVHPKLRAIPIEGWAILLRLYTEDEPHGSVAISDLRKCAGLSVAASFSHIRLLASEGWIEPDLPLSDALFEYRDASGSASNRQPPADRPDADFQKVRLHLSSVGRTALNSYLDGLSI